MPRHDTEITSGRAAKGRLLPDGWHPLQLQALTILTERTASPKELAQELRVYPVSHMAYHVRALRKRGLIEEVRSEPRRGATEHYYRAIRRPVVTEEEFAELSIEERGEITRQVFEAIARDYAAGLAAGTLDADPNRHATRTNLVLDEEGFKDLLDAQMALYERGYEIQAESDERRVQTGEEGRPAVSHIAGFRVPPGGKGFKS